MWVLNRFIMYSFSFPYSLIWQYIYSHKARVNWIDSEIEKTEGGHCELAEPVLPAHWVSGRSGPYRCQWVTVNEGIHDGVSDRGMATWCHIEHSYRINSLIIPWGSRPVVLSLNHSPPIPLQSPAFHLQSKSETQGARDSHQRAFW